MSSELWALDDSPRTLGFVSYMYFQTLVPLSINSTRWWGKVVAGVIYLAYLPHPPHQSLLAPGSSLHPSCRLYTICQAVLWRWLCLSPLRISETIALYQQQNFQLIFSLSPNKYDDVLSQVGLKPWQKINFSYMNGTTLHFLALPVGPSPIFPLSGTVWNARLNST